MLEKNKTRLRIDREIIAESQDFTAEQRAAHALTLQLADKHIAHRVGEQEDVRVLALLAPPPAPREVLGVGLMHVRMVGPEVEVAAHLADVAQALARNLLQELEERRNRFLAQLELASNADLADLYANARAPAGAEAAPTDRGTSPK